MQQLKEQKQAEDEKKAGKAEAAKTQQVDTPSRNVGCV
jgi:hypothetical protein